MTGIGAVAVADLGFNETERNTGSQLGGAPIEGDIGLQANRLKVYVNLCSDQRLARQAELGLRARPDIRAATSKGATAILTAGRVVYVANGRGGVVDELSFEEVVRVVGELAVPPPLTSAAVITPPDATEPRSSRDAGMVAVRAEAAPADVLEQLRKLGELRDAGVLTDAEFPPRRRSCSGAFEPPTERRDSPRRGDRRPGSARTRPRWPVRHWACREVMRLYERRRV